MRSRLPAGPDAFSDGCVLVLFDRGADGRVVGFGAGEPARSDSLRIAIPCRGCVAMIPEGR